jgi:Phage tail lysozyme
MFCPASPHWKCRADVATEQQIWDALTKAGYSANQAAGIMGNMENESSFDQEADAIDSNGLDSLGLIQWNKGTYPNAGKLVTGNPGKDLAAQIAALKTGTAGVASGLQGSTAAQVAGNWAQYVEVCAGCQPGGSQYNQRESNAAQILSEAQSGKWPAGGAGVSGGSSGGSNPAGNSGGSCSGVSFTSPGSWLSPSAWACTTGITNELGNIETGLKDAGERLGLYVLGGIMVLMGIWILFKDSQGSKQQSSAPSGGNDDEKDAAKTGTESASEDIAEGAAVA